MSNAPGTGQVVKDITINHQAINFRFQIKLMASDVPPPPPTGQSIEELKVVASQTKDRIATFDLGGVQQVGEVYVRFSKDTEKTENFEFSLSEDGNNWLGKLTESQQGQSAVALIINPFFNAKYVRFIGSGNNINDSNLFEFFKISGKQLVEPSKPEPKPEPEPKSLSKGLEEKAAIEDTKTVAEQAKNPKNRKDAKETLKKSKK